MQFYDLVPLLLCLLLHLFNDTLPSLLSVLLFFYDIIVIVFKKFLFRSKG